MTNHLSRDEFAAAVLTGIMAQTHSAEQSRLAVGVAFQRADECIAQSAPGVVEALRELHGAAIQMQAIVNAAQIQSKAWLRLNEAWIAAEEVLARYDGGES